MTDDEALWCNCSKDSNGTRPCAFHKKIVEARPPLTQAPGNMPLRWSSCYVEIEENASGWCWRLRDRNNHCLAVSPRDYKTQGAMIEDLELVLPAMTDARKVQLVRWYSKVWGVEEKK